MRPFGPGHEHARAGRDPSSRRISPDATARRADRADMPMPRIAPRALLAGRRRACRRAASMPEPGSGVFDAGLRDLVRRARHLDRRAADFALAAAARARSRPRSPRGISLGQRLARPRARRASIDRRASVVAGGTACRARSPSSLRRRRTISPDVDRGDLARQRARRRRGRAALHRRGRARSRTAGPRPYGGAGSPTDGGLAVAGHRRHVLRRTSRGCGAAGSGTYGERAVVGDDREVTDADQLDAEHRAGGRVVRDELLDDARRASPDR